MTPKIEDCSELRFSPDLKNNSQLGWWLIALIALSAISCRINITTQAQAQTTAPAVATGLPVVRSGPLATPTVVSPSPTPRPPTQTATAQPSPTIVSSQPIVPPTVAPTATIPPVFLSPAGSGPTHIQAPAIGLDAPVTTMGWTVIEQNGGEPVSTWVVPDQAAGWHENSARPGQGSNVVLSGHHNRGSEVFRYLVDLQLGDQIVLQADNQDYYYRVTDRFIVPENEVSEAQREQNAQWIMPTIDERITLVTCWPYNTNTHRLIVVAKPVSASNQRSS